MAHTNNASEHHLGITKCQVLSSALCRIVYLNLNGY